MCNSYNLDTDEPVYFKSWKEEHKDLFLWEVVKASASAPTFFACQILNNERYVDGGVDTTFMGLAGYAEAVKLMKNHTGNITILNVGTGIYKKKYN
jgi:patatin-like phospholipase/acyl hydrolase